MQLTLDSLLAQCPVSLSVSVGRLCFESAARASDFFMNSLNFKLVLNWPQLLCPTSVCVCVECVEFGTNFLLLLLAPTIIWQHTSLQDSCVTSPGQARPFGPGQ